ncbi:MAG: 2-amino-4-hydroxy-6-hydroxymethyldihydropteridine diphosphokinase [Planctomycetota bacterium]
MGKITAYIALGSNLGDREKVVNQAVSCINELEGTVMRRQSDLMETEPVDSPEGAGMFLNGVLQVETELPATELLRCLLEIEVTLGRDRGNAARNDPRTIDLDILLYGDECIDTPELQVPHPRMNDRLFVLWPLMQIAPRLVDPRDGSLLADAFDKLNNESI